MVMALLTAVPAWAETESSINIKLRIEGISQNLYYGEVAIPSTEALTVAQALEYVDKSSDNLTITGLSEGYITDINGDTAGKFGGWDGWLYEVNGIAPTVGVGEYTLSEGDSVLLYYSDLYGAGFQFPKADVTKIDEGIIRFTSTDTTYDESFNPIVAENPVTEATVLFDSSSYTTDENGQIKLEAKDLTAGDHILQISKSTDAGLPLVLRLEPGYTVTVTKTEETVSEAPVSSESEATNPKTSDSQGIAGGLCVSVLALAATLALTKKHEDYKA